MTGDDESKPAGFGQWAPVAGRWELSDDAAVYVGPPTREDRDPSGVGLLLSPAEMVNGEASVTVTIESTAERSAIPDDFREKGRDPTLPQARLMVGFESSPTRCVAAGLAGYNSLYVVDELDIERGGWGAEFIAGELPSLEFDRPYRLSVSLEGQRLGFVVDDVEIAEISLSQPPAGTRLGLVGWGTHRLRFTDFDFDSERARAFVVMQFGEPFDTMYSDVISPIGESLGFEVVRADDITKPGKILDDIVEQILRSDVVVADVSPATDARFNPNVFYELGYAHALHKDVILLCRAGERLPFDISGFRTIMYDDSIGGKNALGQALVGHLASI